MANIEIHDEEFARWLQQRAENQNRSVEDFLKSQTDYPRERVATTEKAEPSEGVRRVRQKIYAKARRYWQSVGDDTKASLSDEELDDQFQWFDEEGIPRLKSEVTDFEPQPGSGAYVARIARQANIRFGTTIDASQADDVLTGEFADHILPRVNDTHGAA